MPKFFSRQRSDSDPEELEAATDDGLTDDDSGEWLAYELHPWSSHARTMLEGVLTSEQIPHSWQGTTLLAHHTHEQAVDDLLEDVSLAEDPRLDADQPTIAFEMDGWSGELVQNLVDRLGQAGIAHEFDDEGDLVVQESGEAQVEAMIDDVLAHHEEEELEELGGLAINELLSSLFVACDRLRRDIHNSDGVTDAVSQGRRLAVVRTPFGFDHGVWRSLRYRALLLADLLEGEPLDPEVVQVVTGEEPAEIIDDHERDDLITAVAQQLRDELQRLI